MFQHVLGNFSAISLCKYRELIQMRGSIFSFQSFNLYYRVIVSNRLNKFGIEE